MHNKYLEYFTAYTVNFGTVASFKQYILGVDFNIH